MYTSSEPADLLLNTPQCAYLGRSYLSYYVTQCLLTYYCICSICLAYVPIHMYVEVIPNYKGFLSILMPVIPISYSVLIGMGLPIARIGTGLRTFSIRPFSSIIFLSLLTTIVS